MKVNGKQLEALLEVNPVVEILDMSALEEIFGGLRAEGDESPDTGTRTTI